MLPSAQDRGRQGPRTAAPALTCIQQQTAQGADQLQGQDGQHQLQVQPAGLREGMLYAEEEEQCRVA